MWSEPAEDFPVARSGLIKFRPKRLSMTSTRLRGCERSPVVAVPGRPAMLIRPAWSLMGRMRYAYKMAVVTLVFLVPLSYVAYAYVSIQQSQTAFSAKER